MILAHRIPLLTRRMHTNTLRAAGAAIENLDWLVVADRDWLEQRLVPLLRGIDRDTEEPRAA